MVRAITFIFLLMLYAQGALADGLLMSWGANDIKGINKEMFDDATAWDVATIIDKSASVKSWGDAYLLAVGASKHKDSVIDFFISQLDNSQETSLINTSRLIIWER